MLCVFFDNLMEMGRVRIAEVQKLGREGGREERQGQKNAEHKNKKMYKCTRRGFYDEFKNSSNGFTLPMNHNLI